MYQTKQTRSPAPEPSTTSFEMQGVFFDVTLA
jgi:hypothetical protein